MRLGSYACRLAPDSLAFRLYGEEIIHERHRHRYEFNCLYEKALVDHGLEDRRPVARRQVRRDRRAAGTPVVSRGAVPPGVQVQAAPPASAVRRASSRPPTGGRWRSRASPRTSRRSETDGPGRFSPAQAARTPPARTRRIASYNCGAVRSVRIADGVILGDGSLVLIAGPCVIESDGHAVSSRGQVAAIARRAGVPYVFKASFDKANRTSVTSFRGPGIDAGLAALAEVQRGGGVPILTDIHEPWQAANGGRSRRRAADPRVPVAADGSHRRPRRRPAES